VEVLDPGPIPYDRIELFGDLDLEHGLRQLDREPGGTAYRLVNLRIEEISDSLRMPWARYGSEIVTALEAGAVLPPIVVYAHASGFGLIDGVNRTNAYVVLRRATIRAYELLPET